ncbi:Uncharacterised protein [uncultured archaeon]|nr:Uncharacterised protein [uncultured archaeon]
MADFPTKGISDQELVDELHGLYQEYKTAYEEFDLYNDWTSQLEDLANRKGANVQISITKKEAEIFYLNQAEHFRKLIGLIKIHEKMKFLRGLYEKHFEPEERSLKLHNLNGMLKSVEEGSIIPSLETFFKAYPYILKRCYTNLEPPLKDISLEK